MPRGNIIQDASSAAPFTLNREEFDRAITELAGGPSFFEVVPTPAHPRRDEIDSHIAQINAMLARDFHHLPPEHQEIEAAFQFWRNAFTNWDWYDARLVEALHAPDPYRVANVVWSRFQQRLPALERLCGLCGDTQLGRWELWSDSRVAWPPCHWRCVEGDHVIPSSAEVAACFQCGQTCLEHCPDVHPCPECSRRECECIFCNRCNYQSPNGYRICDDCNNCRECCTCEPDEDDDDSYDSSYVPVSFVTRRAPTFWDAGNLRKRNRSKRFLAAEIEIARADRGPDIDRAVSTWRAAVVHDGSLTSGGFEINTAPANGDLFLSQIEDLGAAFRAQNAVADVFCGLHVHIDARDFGYYDLRRLAFLYEKIEPALFSLVSPGRRRSGYCLPCGEKYAVAFRKSGKPSESKKALVEALYGSMPCFFAKHGQDKVRPGYCTCGEYQCYVLQRVETYTRRYGHNASGLAEWLRDMYPHKDGTVKDAYGRDRYNGVRYHALNLHSWFYRGTVECRLFGGTTQPDKIANWAMLWASIVDKAAAMSERQVLGLQGTSLEMLFQVAPTDAVREWVLDRRAFVKQRWESSSVDEDDLKALSAIYTNNDESEGEEN